VVQTFDIDNFRGWGGWGRHLLLLAIVPSLYMASRGQKDHTAQLTRAHQTLSAPHRTLECRLERARTITAVYQRLIIAG
jgi:hypothetical protein